MKSHPPSIGSEWPEHQNWIYAGIVRNCHGGPDYHLLVCPERRNGINWKDAMQWAESLGASLPLRREQAILFGQVPELFRPRCYWSCEQYAGHSGLAWIQDFEIGGRLDGDKNEKYCACAVKRIPIDLEAA